MASLMAVNSDRLLSDGLLTKTIYHRDELLLIRESIQNENTTHRVSPSTWITINELGIVSTNISSTKRGKKAGWKTRKTDSLQSAITTIVSNGFDQQNTNNCSSTVVDGSAFGPIPVVTSYRSERYGNVSSTVNNNNLINIPVYKPSCKLALINCQSIRNKTTLVMDHLIEHQIDIAVFTETWLASGNRDLPIIGELELPGFQLYHKPREHRGGGVGVLVNTSFTVKVQNSPVYSSFESMRVSIQVKSICIHLVVVYRVPPSTKNRISAGDFMEQFTEYLDTLSTLNGQLIIAGDFNVHWENKDNQERNELNLLLDTYSFNQHVSGPTHIKNHTIDLIITRDHDNCLLSTEVNELISDHHAIHCTIQCSKPPPKKKTITYRKIKSINPETLQQAIAESSLINSQADSLDSLVHQYQTDITQVLDTLAPIKSKSFVERALIPWLNDDIIKSKKQKRKLEKQWRTSGLTIHYQMYQSEKRKLHTLITKAKITILRNLKHVLAIKVVCSKLWLTYRTPKASPPSPKMRVY